MSIPKVNPVKADPPTKVETRPQSATESKTTQETKSTQHQATFDTPQAKTEGAKAQTSTQAQSPAGQTNTYHSQETSRQTIDIRPPGEDKAQYKDSYNPASTILRSQETEKREPGDMRLQKYPDKDREGSKGDKERSRGDRARRNLRESVGPARRLTQAIMGASIFEGQTQDAFVPAAQANRTTPQQQDKNLAEQIREYNLGALGSAIYTAVSSNMDKSADNGIGPNMQKILLNQISEAMSDTPDIMSGEYRPIVREIVQGSLQATRDHDAKFPDMIKMLTTSLIALSPHDDDPRVIAEAARLIASETVLGKLNIGYTMKLASYSLGGALFMLSVYFKNYQSRLQYSKEIDQRIKQAVNDGIWEATGDITGYSETHAVANTDRFVAGRIEEEKMFQQNLVRGIILMPMKKLERIEAFSGLFKFVRSKLS